MELSTTRKKQAMATVIVTATVLTVVAFCDSLKNLLKRMKRRSLSSRIHLRLKNRKLPRRNAKTKSQNVLLPIARNFFTRAALKISMVTQNLSILIKSSYISDVLSITALNVEKAVILWQLLNAYVVREHSI
jgi:hypothetical protein